MEPRGDHRCTSRLNFAMIAFAAAGARKVFIPWFLGILLMLAGAGYVIDTLANAFLANYDDYATVFLLIVAVPSVVGELAFTIWLLWRGGKAQEALA